MVVLKIIQPVRLDDEILKPGDMLRVQNEGELVIHGYARRLSKEETRTILDEYTSYAEKIFHGNERVNHEQTKKHNQERLF